MNSENLVVLRMFSSVVAAEEAAANLESNGIECVIQADDAGGMLPTLQCAEGVKLLVAAEDELEAAQILTAKTDISPEALEALASRTQKQESALTTTPGNRLSPLIAAFLAGALALYALQWWNHLGTKTHYWDANHDGRPDARYVVRDGYTIEHDRDRNFDGRMDEWYHYERGELVRFETDENFDGKVDHWWTYTNGIPVEGKRDTDFNGVPDVFSRYENAATLIEDWRPNGTPVITRREVFHHGVLTQEFQDVDRDGFFDVDIRYDAFLNPVQTNHLKLLSSPPVTK